MLLRFNFDYIIHGMKPRDDTCSEIQSIEAIVDIIRENNVDDEVENKIIPLDQSQGSTYHV